MHRLDFIGGIWQAGREHFETLIRDENIVFDKDSELFPGQNKSGSIAKTIWGFSGSSGAGPAPITFMST